MSVLLILCAVLVFAAAFACTWLGIDLQRRERGARRRQFTCDWFAAYLESLR